MYTRILVPVTSLACLLVVACGDDGQAESTTFATFTSATAGDGDGDTTGDGDGAPGDGDGTPGDGDGDGTPGDGDGQPGPVCGNGVVEADEECDDGNPSDEDACTSSCLDAFCGDGIVHMGVEGCDDGNNVDGDGCDATCQAELCGDGQIQPPEQCDDGNMDDTDNCTNMCLFGVCGDGIVLAGIEQCDDGNMDDTDACVAGCVPAACGDGFVQANVEQCDDANMDNTDACVGACVAAACGDGFVQANVEQCDDGNNVDNDACGNDCISNCSPGSINVAINFNQTMGWLSGGCCNEPNYRVANGLNDVLSVNFNAALPQGTTASAVSIKAGIRHACNGNANAFEFRLNNTFIGGWNSGNGPHCSCGNPALSTAMFNGLAAFLPGQNTLSVVHNASGSCHEALGTVPNEQAGTAFVVTVNYVCN